VEMHVLAFSRMAGPLHKGSLRCDSMSTSAPE
jgi:hypothetical protein